MTSEDASHKSLAAAHVCVCMFRNSKLPFTKNPEKYLRYSPEDVKLTLEKFFDGGAK